jgi:hypothetical protein
METGKERKDEDEPTVTAEPDICAKWRILRLTRGFSTWNSVLSRPLSPNVTNPPLCQNPTQTHPVTYTTSIHQRLAPSHLSLLIPSSSCRCISDTSSPPCLLPLVHSGQGTPTPIPTVL